jgi:hypothetical protein
MVERVTLYSGRSAHHEINKGKRKGHRCLLAAGGIKHKTPLTWQARHGRPIAHCGGTRDLVSENRHGTGARQELTCGGIHRHLGEAYLFRFTGLDSSSIQGPAYQLIVFRSTELCIR